jgi:hypothetical protein
MGTISIFALEFSGTRFACSRDFSGIYHLKAGDYTLSMVPDVAVVLADGGARIRLRAQVAAHYGWELKAGATFRRDMLAAVDGRTVHIEIGVADAGDGVYVEIGTARMMTDRRNSCWPCSTGSAPMSTRSVRRRHNSRSRLFSIVRHRVPEQKSPWGWRSLRSSLGQCHFHWNPRRWICRTGSAPPRVKQ